MAEHHFHLTARWPGGRNGVGTLYCGHLDTNVSIATSMGGPGVGTNPDEMLLGAAATCYLITLAAMIERAGLAVDALSLESTVTVEVDGGGFKCKRIVHQPRVTLAAGADAGDMHQLEHLVTMAEKRCMISNALRGNVEIQVEPRLDQTRQAPVKA